jgi:hypothetical protein
LGGFFDKIKDAITGHLPWWDRPTLLAIPSLINFRNQLRQENLFDTEDGPLTGDLPPVSAVPEVKTQRTVEGTYNDLNFPRMGCVGARFGRNVPLNFGFPDEKNLLNPNPRDVSRVLMTRTEFEPATIVNLLAAAWIQFETHDWFSHGRFDTDPDPIQIPLADSDPWPQHPMTVPHTPLDPTRSPASTKPPTHIDKVTHWWDGSQIYGSDADTTNRIRTHVDGKVNVKDCRLPVDPDTGIDRTGFFDNWWMGLSMLHGLFAMEHNAICDALKKENAGWSDEQLFQKARMINAALMAKIHTLEWTTAILPNPTTQLAMRVNWHGLVGEGLQMAFPALNDSELLGGIVGSETNQHTAPYAMTEEFISVYRMHPLMPDEFTFISVGDGSVVGQYELPAILGIKNRPVFESIAPKDLFYSFGITNPGAIRLHNYPRHLQHLTRDNGTIFDMAAVDVLRDRERGVPRYNKFRELLHMDPVTSFEQITSNAEWAAQIKEVYNGDLSLVDLLVGLLAEDLPKGFGFSETAFRVFILMASRRLKSDRFYTDDYRPEVYTQTGLDWVENNGMASVLTRHMPELKPALEGVSNPFASWKKLH